MTRMALEQVRSCFSKIKEMTEAFVYSDGQESFEELLCRRSALLDGISLAGIDHFRQDPIGREIDQLMGAVVELDKCAAQLYLD